MRQNPINTAAGKSRKGPQWPTRPTTHKLTGSDIPTRNHMRVAGLKRSPSGWVTGVTPLKPFLEGAVKRTKRRTQTLYCTLVWSICSEFELYSGPPHRYDGGTSGWPRLYLTQSGTEQPTVHLVCLTAASAKLDAAHTDKLWGQFQCGWVSLSGPASPGS